MTRTTSSTATPGTGSRCGARRTTDPTLQMVSHRASLISSVTRSLITSGADPELDPLKWVEENIPDMEGALPIIDSEEEIETTKEEISKLH